MDSLLRTPALIATALLFATLAAGAAAAGPAPVYTITVTGVGNTELSRTGGGQCRGNAQPAEVVATIAGGLPGNQITGEVRCFGVIASCTATQLIGVGACVGNGVQPGAPFGCTWTYAAGPLTTPPSSWTVQCRLY